MKKGSTFLRRLMVSMSIQVVLKSILENPSQMGQTNPKLRAKRWKYERLFLRWKQQISQTKLQNGDQYDIGHILHLERSVNK
jgi:hypothetical protein